MKKIIQNLLDYSKKSSVKFVQKVFSMVMPSIIITISACIVIVALFAMVTKGQQGNPLYFQSTRDTRVGGPFEASNSTARFALTEAIVVYKTFLLPLPLAEFASPDVVKYKSSFISIFTPGVSFIGIPFYLLGEIFGMPQLFTYFSTVLFAIIDIFLIARLASKLGASSRAGILAGCIFAFATNALVYTLSFTQHIFSVTIVLLALLNAFDRRTWKNNILFGLYFGAGILIDIPNAFFLFPIGLYILAKSITIEHIRQLTRVSLKSSLFGLIVGVLPMVILFGWYNYKTTGSFTTLAQRLGRTDYFAKGAPPQLQAQEPSSSQPASFQLNLHLTFATRPQLEGLYTLLISDERAWIYYCPIVLVGIFGFILLYRNPEYKEKALLILSIVLVDILIYSMFDDPWGGWAFGPRYLIPGAALLCTFIAPLLDRFKKNIFFIVLLGLILYYSTWISFLGALTTASIPPKVEAINLSSHIPYTYDYNLELMQKGMSSSLVHNIYFPDMSPQIYLRISEGLALGLFTLLYLSLFLPKRRKEQNK